MTVTWYDSDEVFPAVKAEIGDLQFCVSGQSPKGVRWWWYVEIGSDDAGQEDMPTVGEAMKSAEEFAPKLQAFLDSLKEKKP